jgi:hypothetical protein
METAHNEPPPSDNDTSLTKNPSPRLTTIPWELEMGRMHEWEREKLPPYNRLLLWWLRLPQTDRQEIAATGQCAAHIASTIDNLSHRLWLKFFNRQEEILKNNEYLPPPPYEEVMRTCWGR